MHYQPRIQSVIIKILVQDTKEQVVTDLRMSEEGNINVFEVLFRLKEARLIGEHALVFYFDNSLQAYVHCSDDNCFVSVNHLILKNLLIFKVEPKASDQVQANPSTQEQTRGKRSPQRQIAEVFELVYDWRKLCSLENGQLRVTMEQAALKVGIPRKSLQDYYLLLRNGRYYNFKFTDPCCKIGVLRAFIRERKAKERSNSIEIAKEMGIHCKMEEDAKEEFNEGRFFKELQSELFGQEMKGTEFDLDQYFYQH